MRDEAPDVAGTSERTRLSRRGLLGLAGAGAAGLVVGGGAGAGIALAAASAGGASGADTNARYPFEGSNQAGITTPVQDRLHFASFDLSSSATRDDLASLLKDWSAAARAMAAGKDVGSGAVPDALTYPPDDTGEALGLGPSGLTITIGLGPTVFTATDGSDRFGLRAKQPKLLQPLPRFSGDALQAGLTGGDLCIQACADDPQVAVHAIRNLSRIAFGRASIRWSQLGFGRTSSTSTSQVTARNLMGFKDGTANLKAEEPSTAESVWVQAGDDAAADWLAGGSYLVARKIRMLIEDWDHQQLGEQERVFGRDKGEGAPLSGGTEFTALDLDSVGPAGKPAIDRAAHVRLAHSSTSGAVILRRGFNFVDGNDDLGLLSAGLFFIAYGRSPEQFIAIQRSLAGHDALNEYIKHIGSGIWAVPPGASPGGWVGETLFA